MKQLKTLKAEYTVDSVNGPSRTPQTARVTYIKDNDKFCIVETRTDPNGRQVFDRTVYDGLDVKRYQRVSDDRGPAQGAILPADHRTITFTDNDLMSAAGFSLIRPGSDERFAQHEFEFRGIEAGDGCDCLEVVFIAPSLPGHRAFNYVWIEVTDARHVLRRQKCLIDDRLGIVLYELQYGYESLAGYPFPTEIRYRRYDINSRGYRSLDYEKLMRVQTLRINEPVDPCEFEFTFPPGTVVNVAPPTVSAAELKDPSPMRQPDPSELPFDPTLTQPDPRTEFSFDPNEGLIFVPVQFGPGAHDFIVDTGCSHTIFDLSFRPQLGAPGPMTGMSTLRGRAAVQVFVAPRAFVGPFNIADCNEVRCANLSRFTLSIGRDVPGVLGMDMLKSHVVRVDFDRGRMAFFDDVQQDRREWGEEFPLTYNDNGIPLVRLAVGDLGEHDFAIDTGYAASGTLAEDIFARVVAATGAQSAPTATLTAAGTVESRQCRAGLLKLGLFEYKNLVFDEASGTVVGLGFLSRHTVTFDFPNDKLYLKEAKRFGAYDEVGMCGVSLIRSEAKTVVHRVWEGEPAAKAGIKAGDVILKLQGRDANTYTMWEIGQLCRSGHGKEITLTIQHGSEVRDVVVVLERQI
ncbi:MAG: PDZ domain-containing protein [Sedimentisphaerales bacterium]|nr:PDZ domain-containing protein [Sedimentisphaerales bacterium]